MDYEHNTLLFGEKQFFNNLINEYWCLFSDTAILWFLIFFLLAWWFFIECVSGRVILGPELGFCGACDD